MRVLFFGIYSIGVKSLRRLCGAGYTPVAVITKPDPEGGLQPVAEAARLLGIPVLQPVSPKDESFQKAVREIGADLALVAGYHKIIPAAILDLPPLGTLNLHASLLPRYRGPCTWKWAILRGESSTGVTVHYMNPALDCGDIVDQRSVSILPDDTGGTLFERLGEVGAELLSETVGALAEGKARRVPQDESLATYFGYPTEEDARIDWTRSPDSIRDQVRGLNPSPGAWTSVGERRMTIWSAFPAGPAMRPASPGTVLECRSRSLIVATGVDTLEISALGLAGHGPADGIVRAGELGISPGVRLGWRGE